MSKPFNESILLPNNDRSYLSRGRWSAPASIRWHVLGGAKKYGCLALCFVVYNGVAVQAQIQPPAAAANGAQVNGAQVNGAQVNGAQANTAPSDKVQTVAVVNKEAISRQALAKACLSRFGEEVLESMVNKSLIQAECQRQNIVITEKDIMEQLARVAQSVGNEGLGVEQYLQLIAERKQISPQRIKDEVIWTDLALRRLAAGNLNVSDQEVQEVIDIEFGPKVQVSMIVEKSAQQASVLLQMARKNPEQFGNIAKDYSIDEATAPYMGLAPTPIARGSMEPEVENVIFTLKQGEISEAVKIVDRFYIFKCQRHFPASQLNDEQRALVDQRIRGALMAEKLRVKAPEIFQALQQNAEVVNVLNDPQLSQQYPGIAAIVNQRQIPIQELAEECIARYGVDVLEVEIHRTMLKQQLKANNLTVNEEELREEIERTAKSAGQVDADGNVNLKDWLDRVTENDASKVDYYVQDAVWPSTALRKLVQNEVQITEDDMKKGFEANYGRRVRVLAIVTTDQKSCEKVWRMARDNPTIENFQRLAETYSMEPSSQFNRGEVPPVARFTGRQNLEDAAFAMRPGEISGIINEGNSWVILYCLGLTEPVVNNIDTVKEELYQELVERKTIATMTRRMQQIVSESQIDNFLAETSKFSRSDMDRFRQSQQPGGARKQ